MDPNRYTINACKRLLLLSLIVLPGCATHRVRVNAYLSHDLPFPEPDTQPPPAIAVVVGSEPDEPLLEAEVARKVKHLLGEQGYLIGDENSAPYILTCWVSIDEGVAATTTDYVYRSRVSTSYVYTRHGHWSAMTFHTPGVFYEVPYTTIYYTRFLGLTLYERERWAGADKEQLDRAAIWTCTVTSIGISSDLRSLVNFLLAAAFDQFGADTARERIVEFAKDDPRVMEIARAGRRETIDIRPADQPAQDAPHEDPPHRVRLDARR